MSWMRVRQTGDYLLLGCKWLVPQCPIECLNVLSIHICRHERDWRGNI